MPKRSREERVLLRSNKENQMELKEKPILPQRCIDCQERKEMEDLVGPDAYCYDCDWALDRFEIVNPKFDFLKNF